MFNTLGMKATQDKASADVTQTTFPRYHVECHDKQNFVSSTGHSMYLTTILTNEDMWNSLDLEDQMHFQTAAKICARTERAKSVADAEEIATDKDKQDSLGISEVPIYPAPPVTNIFFTIFLSSLKLYL